MKRRFFIFLFFACASVCNVRAGLREASMALVDSAYMLAMSGALPQAVAVNNDGLLAVPEDSMDIRCEFYSCLLYCYHRLGDYERALEYGEACLRFDEQDGNPENISASLGNLAGIYSSAGQQEVAIEYLERAITIEQDLLQKDSTHTPKSLAIREAMLGEVLLAKRSDLDHALALTEDALAIDRSLDRRLQVGMRLAQLGHIYEALGRHKKARECTVEALSIARETGNMMTEVQCLLQLERYEEAASLARKTGLKKQEYEACDRLYSRAKSVGRSTEALRWLERARELHESLMSEESQRQLTIAQVRYDSYRKEQQLADQQVELEQKKAREKVLWAFSILALLVVALLIFLIVLLRHRKQAIEQTAADKARQYSILSHDLRNPIVAQQQVLKQLYTNYDTYSQKETRTRIGQLLAASDGQLNLLRNLQEIVQLNRNLRPIRPARLDLSALIREAVTDVESAATLKEVEVQIRAERVLVTADRDSLRTILRNLLGNAIKFSPKNSTVEVGTTDHGFYVRDHGEGMDEAKQNEVLTATTQVHSSIGTDGESGTGFGLLLCRELLRLNNGKMTIESVPRQGTTIICEL